MQNIELSSWFENIIGSYERSRPYLNADQAFSVLIENKRKWIDRLRVPEFPVAFLGAFSSGKSTIINAILERNVLPESTGACTAVPTIVRQGDGEHACVHFLDETARRRLRDLYIEEICKELRKNHEEILTLDNKDIISLLEKEINTFRHNTGSFLKDEYFHNLKQVVDKWGRHVSQIEKIKISNISDYVTEDYDDILLVDKVEVFCDVKIPEGIVLVDLPGLGVVNPRHREITKSYIENEAKAFIVVSAVFDLLEGPELELLSEIYQSRKRVLNRAFWVINRWDTGTSQQKDEEEQNFYNTIIQYNFDINPSRLFKVSALNYLISILIKSGHDYSTIKNAESLARYINKDLPYFEQVDDIIQSNEELRDFAKFKNQLFEYLNNSARAEFLREGRTEYEELRQRLAEILDSVYKNIENGRPINAVLRDRELISRIDDSIEELNAIVADKIMELRVDKIDYIELWADQDVKSLENQVTTFFKDLDRKEFKNELRKGIDLDKIFSRVPRILEEKLSISEKLRHQLQRLAEANVVNIYSMDLFRKLEDTGFLPNDIRMLLFDMLSSRDMSSRIKGLCDVLLYDYSQKVDELGIDILNLNVTKNTISNIMSSKERSSTVEDIKGFIRTHTPLAIKIARSSSLLSGSLGLGPLLSLDEEDMRNLHSKMLQELSEDEQEDNSSEQPLAFDEKIEFILNKYQQELINFLNQLQVKINLLIQRCIKNYYEELELSIKHLLKDEKVKIADVVADQLDLEEFNETIKQEQEKYESLSELFSLINKTSM